MIEDTKRRARLSNGFVDALLDYNCSETLNFIVGFVSSGGMAIGITGSKLNQIYARLNPALTINVRFHFIRNLNVVQVNIGG